MILDREKLSALAKSSHSRCHGTGIYLVDLRSALRRTYSDVVRDARDA